jgi:hypothetical protein
MSLLARARACKRVRSNVGARTCACTSKGRRLDAMRTRTHTYAHVHARTRTCAHVCTRVRARACVRQPGSESPADDSDSTAVGLTVALSHSLERQAVAGASARSARPWAGQSGPSESEPGRRHGPTVTATQRPAPAGGGRSWARAVTVTVTSPGRRLGDQAGLSRRVTCLGDHGDRRTGDRAPVRPGRGPGYHPSHPGRHGHGYP